MNLKIPVTIEGLYTLGAFLVLLLLTSCGGGGTTPEEPQTLDLRIVGTIETTCSEDIALNGNIIYVADGPGGIEVIDISDKSNPVLIRNIPTLYAIRVYIYQGHLYVCDASAGLKVYSISSPSDPVMTYSEDTEWATSCAFRDGYLYLGDYFKGFRIYNVTDPANPELITVKTGSIPRDVTIEGDTLYISDAPFGLVAYSITDPDNPVWEYSDGAYYANYEDIIAYGSFTLVARNDEESKITIFHHEIQTGFGRAGEIAPARFIDSITSSNEFLVVSCGEDGIIGYHMQSLPLLTKIWELDTPGYTRRAKLDGQFIYVADMSTLRIYEIIPGGAG